MITWLGTPAPRRDRLGQADAGCVTPPCPNGTIKSYDPACPSGTVRCPPGALDPCPANDLVFSNRAGRCVPIRCPSGTVRNERDECEVVVQPTPPAQPQDFCTIPSLSFLSQEVIRRFEACWKGQCSTGEFLALVSELNTLFQTARINNQPAIVAQIQYARDLLVAGGASKCPSVTRPQPAPGECLNPQQVASAQPCFYMVGFGEDPSNWKYEGPPELLAGANSTDVVKFCIDTGFTDLIQDTGDGYFVLPLCDSDTLPAPPSCITPEQRRALTSCTAQGVKSGDRAANYFCWIGLKAPQLLQEWIDTPDCPPGEVPDTPPQEPPIAPGECRPGFVFNAAANPPCVAITPTQSVPTAKKSSAALPLLIGAAVVGAAVYYLS